MFFCFQVLGQKKKKKKRKENYNNEKCRSWGLVKKKRRGKGRKGKRGERRKREGRRGEGKGREEKGGEGKGGEGKEDFAGSSKENTVDSIHNYCHRVKNRGRCKSLLHQRRLY